MFTRKKLYRIYFLIVCMLPAMAIFSQPAISGPVCVIPGTTYQYNISGQWDSSSTMQVCITGGIIVATGSTCTANGKPIPFVQAVWNNGTSGSILLTSSAGNNTLDVSITTPLVGGTIIISTKSQAIKYNAVPAGVSCSASSGGSCSPNFSYQWQESLDIVSWSDIKGATGQHLGAIVAKKQTTYYRRKVTETVSSSIAYSDIAIVDVYAPVHDNKAQIVP